MTRYDIINKLIDIRGYNKFLEIGTYRGECFNNVHCPIKESVDPDPESNATHLMTSDEFFKQNRLWRNKYDIVFIDGLHEHSQVWRDILNSLVWLNDGGTIVMHDCLPTTEEMQRWSDHSHQGEVWTGDTWKAYLKAQSEMPYYTYVIDTDFGCGVIDTSKENHKRPRIVDMEALEWKDFDRSKFDIRDGIIP